MTKVISIINLKGGVGKTQSAINIAHFLPGKVLLVDLDPQGNTTLQLNVPYERTLFDFFTGTEPLTSYIQSVEKIDVIPNDLRSVRLPEFLSGRYMREFILKNEFKKLNQYDYIVLDCPPSFGVITQNGAIASDFICVPVNPEPHSVTGLNLLEQSLESIDCKIHTIFVTMHDTRTKIHKNIVRQLFDMYGSIMQMTGIPRATIVNESVLNHQPMCLYDEESKVSKSYKELTEELVYGFRK